MKLQHTLGGLEGLGAVDVQKRVFVAPWEKRIFGIHVAMMALSAHLDEAIPNYSIESVPSNFKDIWTWADLRRGAEAMNPLEYFKYRYYEKWLGGISGFFVEQGYISPEELAAKTEFCLREGNIYDAALLQDEDRAAIDEQVIRYLQEGDSPKREIEAAPQFKVGDRVAIKTIPVGEHTRLPGYLRGKQGIIDVVYEGAYAYFPGPVDAIGPAMPVYSVRFDPVEIWGEEKSEAGGAVYADLFEVYLAPTN